jgi:hypothetical protein
MFSKHYRAIFIMGLRLRSNRRIMPVSSRCARWTLHLFWNYWNWVWGFHWQCSLSRFASPGHPSLDAIFFFKLFQSILERIPKVEAGKFDSLAEAKIINCGYLLRRNHQSSQQIHRHADSVISKWNRRIDSLSSAQIYNLGMWESFHGSLVLPLSTPNLHILLHTKHPKDSTTVSLLFCYRELPG